MKPLFSLAALAAASALVFSTSAQAHLVFYQGTFAPEAVGATGTGTLRLEYDDEGHTLAISAIWSGLSGTTNNAHIHCCTPAPRTGTAGVALAQAGLLPGFPLLVNAGSYIRTINLSQTDQYSAAYLTASGGTAAGAESRLLSNLASGNAYFNIHTTTFGGGEIRTFVTAVPEPGSLALLLAAAGLAAVATRKKQGV